MRKISSIISFLKEGVSTDLKYLRTRIALFIFNLLPDFYILMPFRNVFLRLGGAKIPLFGCYIRTPFACGNLGNLEISAGVFINKNAYIEANGKVLIGKSCQIGPYLKIENTNHLPAENMRVEIFPVTIEDGVWLASGVTLLPRALVRSKCTIAAGAVVVGEIAGPGIFGGVPAKRIEKRKQ